MSRKKVTPAEAGLLHLLDESIDGRVVPGGCDYCDAYQVPELVGHGVWKITVRHDDWCVVVGGKGRP